MRICYTYVLFLFICSGNGLEKLKKHYGSKTPYRFIQNIDTGNGFYEGCESKKFWTLVRHGTRLPPKNIITDMIDVLPQLRADIIMSHKEGRGHLTEMQLQQLEDWYPKYTNVSQEKNLETEGEIEMKLLGERMQKRFEKLLPTEYKEHVTKFRVTDTQRTRESAKNFAVGLFGPGMAKNIVYPLPIKNDPILRFYKNCTRWQQEVKNNKMTYKEYNLYISSQEMYYALKNITGMLGLAEDLTFTTAKLLYQVCGFETAWDEDSVSPWCFGFSAESVLAMEYAEDMKFYWKDGYGKCLSKQLACMVSRDIYHFFSKEDSHLSSLYFTHSGTLLKTLAHWGLYKPADGDLRHDYRDAKRVWRTSHIDGFGSNLAFILYKCGSSSKILTLYQERPVRLPQCDDEDLCPIEKFFNAGRMEIINNCDLGKLCKVPDQAIGSDDELNNDDDGQSDTDSEVESVQVHLKDEF